MDLRFSGRDAVENAIPGIKCEAEFLSVILDRFVGSHSEPHVRL